MVFTVIGKQMAKQVPEVAPHRDHDAAHGRWLEEEVGRRLPRCALSPSLSNAIPNCP